MKSLVVLILIFLIFSNALASASIYTCDSSGGEKTIFYEDEIVYVGSNTNITDQTKTINFYVLNQDRPFGTNLTQEAIIKKEITTNSSGHFNITPLWDPKLIVGDYNVVVDVNENATFDPEDFFYVFSVTEEYMLKISKGANSPFDHEWYIEKNGSVPNPMLQLILETGSYEGVLINKIYIVAFGTGNDKDDVKYIGACSDINKDGNCAVGEDLIGFGEYKKDDGILEINMNLQIAKNSSKTLLFFYVMKNSSGSEEGKTYGFDVSMINAVGLKSGKNVKVSGLPIKSAIKTVYSQTTTTTTTIPTTTTTITTTTVPVTEEEEKKINFFVGISVAIFAAIAIITIFYFFFLRAPQQVYTYKP